MVGNNLPGPLKPERGDAVQDDTLVGDQLLEDDIKRGDPVRDHDQELVTEIVDIADLAFDIQGQLDKIGLAHEFVHEYLQ